MRIIISGPTGAIGHALIERCLDNNDSVLAICHKGSKRINSLPHHKMLKVLELDLNEYDTYIVNNDFGKYDIFYHFAWNGTFGEKRNDVFLQTDNIKYSLSAVKLANKFGCSTFIGAGSQAEYGRVEVALKSDIPAFPENGYGISKLCAGQLTRIYCNQLRIKHIWVRILSVYGPYDGENSMIISSLKKMINNEDTFFTKGEQLWDYLYSSDAADALYLLGEKGIGDKIYVLGSGCKRKLSEYIKIMARVSDYKKECGIGLIPYNSNQVMNLVADISELKKDTEFEPKTDFENGIKYVIDYLKKL